MSQPTCEQRITAHLRGRMADLRRLMRIEQGQADADENLGDLCEYGLSADYVAPGTFNGQRRGFFRYQLSWGGPQDEFRFFVDESGKPYRIQYWFLDWFDGAHRNLRGPRFELLAELFDWLFPEPDEMIRHASED